MPLAMLVLLLHNDGAHHEPITEDRGMAGLISDLKNKFTGGDKLNNIVFIVFDSHKNHAALG